MKTCFPRETERGFQCFREKSSQEIKYFIYGTYCSM